MCNAIRMQIFSYFSTYIFYHITIKQWDFCLIISIDTAPLDFFFMFVYSTCILVQLHSFKLSWVTVGNLLLHLQFFRNLYAPLFDSILFLSKFLNNCSCFHLTSLLLDIALWVVNILQSIFYFIMLYKLTHRKDI